MRVAPLSAPPLPALIVNAALTGMVPRRDRVPRVPVSAEAIVQDVVACHVAGATIVHLHARDAAENPTWHREAYAEFVPEAAGRREGSLPRRAASARV